MSKTKADEVRKCIAVVEVRKCIAVVEVRECFADRF